MVFDHMFALIDNLSFAKKEENNTGGAKPHKNNKYFRPSLDTAFLVIVVILMIVAYGFIKLKKRFKNHYRKKYNVMELRDVKSSAPLATFDRQIY